MLGTAAAALIALAACDPAASRPSTGSPALSSNAPLASPAVVAEATTPGPIRPPGVPPNAEPLLFGCGDEGVTRCAELAPGTYYTAGEWAFLPGLTFSLPAGWSSLSNDAADLELHRTGDDHNEILFWRDVVPWRGTGPAPQAEPGPDAWLTHLDANPCLDVSKVERVVLGSWTGRRGDGQPADLEAVAMSVGIAHEAVYVAAGCPESGVVDILTDPNHWDHAFGIGGDEMNDPGCPCRSAQRLYFASIGYPAHRHLLVVVLQSYGPTGDVDARLASLQTAAQPVLDSLIVPAIIVDN